MTAEISRTSVLKFSRAQTKAPAGKPDRTSKPTAATPTEPKLHAVIRLMRRPEGADLAELTALTGWQKHSVRGAIAGSLKKKLGLAVITTKEAGRGTVYRIAPADLGEPREPGGPGEATTVADGVATETTPEVVS